MCIVLYCIVLYFTFAIVFYLMSVLLVSTAISHTQLSEGEVFTLLEQVNKKMKASEGALETLRVQMEKEEQELQNKVDGYRLVTTGCTCVCRCMCVYVCVCVWGGARVCEHMHTRIVFLTGIIIPIISNDPTLLIIVFLLQSIHDLIFPCMNICS